MTKYIIKRVLLIIPVILAVILLVFGLLYITPGSNIPGLASHAGDGFDKVLDAVCPGDGFFARYLRYCYNVFFKLDFSSIGRRNSAIDLGRQLVRRWGFSLRIMGWSLLVSIVIGIPSGIISAICSNKWQDRIITAITTVMSSIPSYCLAIGFALLFALKLRWLPSYGIDDPKGYILPVAVVSAMGISQFIRVVRAAVLETIEKNYITALRAAGLKETLIIGVHALRNALVPITASLGETVTKILGGCFIAEKFFAVPGIGFYLIEAIRQVDMLIVLACATTTAFLLVIVSLVTDIICLAADPQLRKRIASGGKMRGAKHGK